MRRYALVLPALVLLGAFVLLPLVSAFWTSFHRDTPFAERTFVGLDNYAELARDGAARGTIEFTFLFVGVSCVLEVLLGLAIALVLHHAFRGRGLFRAVVLLPWAVPTVVAAVMWRYVFHDQLGVLNLALYGGDLDRYRAWLAQPAGARAAIIAADVWKTSAFAGLLLLAGLQTIPKEVLDAARVDGAGPFRRFVSVTLPLLRPALLLALLFRILDAFRVFDLVYVLTQGAPGDSTSVLSLFGYRKMFPEQRFGYGSAASVVVFLLVAAVAIPTIRLLGARRNR